jgi:hypothetical protein
MAWATDHGYWDVECTVPAINSAGSERPSGNQFGAWCYGETRRCWVLDKWIIPAMIALCVQLQLWRG